MPEVPRGGGVVARAGHDPDPLREPEPGRDVGPDGADDLEALKEPGHLRLAHAAELQHLLRPALVLHVEQQHAARVGVVAAVHAREHVVDVVLRQHDLADAREVFGLVLLHPQDLRRGEAREGDVRGQGREPVAADLIVEIIDLLLRAPVVPEDGGADDRVVFVEHDQAVHLAAAADAGHLRGVRPGEQLLHAAADARPPVLGLLLRPAGLREIERILPAHLADDGALFVHQRQLDGRGPEIDSDKQFRENHLR